mgnify:CR=1 FL=1
MFTPSLPPMKHLLPEAFDPHVARNREIPDSDSREFCRHQLTSDMCTHDVVPQDAFSFFKSVTNFAVPPPLSERP